MTRVMPTFLATTMLLSACAQAHRVSERDGPAMASAAAPQDAFWSNLRALCESAADGVLLQAPDEQISPDARLVVHFRNCGTEELRFPLHVDENRSRTWVFIPARRSSRASPRPSSCGWYGGSEHLVRRNDAG